MIELFHIFSCFFSPWPRLLPRPISSTLQNPSTGSLSDDHLHSHPSIDTGKRSTCSSVLTSGSHFEQHGHAYHGGRGAYPGTRHEICEDWVRIKEWYHAFWGVLIDLIIGFLGLIIKSFDNQTERWTWLSNPLIIKLFEMLDDNHDYFVYKRFTHKSNKSD